MDTGHAVGVCCNEKGMVIIYAALLMVVLLGFLGLAVDSSRLFKVRNELQNSADASALKGADFLWKTTGPGTPPTLDWASAEAMARDMVTKTTSDNKSLADAVVTVGYWDLQWDNLSDHDLKATTIVPTNHDIPAVKVRVNRSDGSNGGPVTNFFTKIIGVPTSAVGSKPAVAISGYTGSMPPNDLFPMTVCSCMTTQYFSQDPLPFPPLTLNINSPYGPVPDCETGQWTSFDTDSNAARTIKDLFRNGNAVPVQTGDDIWVQPGVEGTLYNFVEKEWLPPGGKDVIMAVVDCTGNSHFAPTGDRDMPVQGFVAFHIDGVKSSGEPKYIYGHFIDYFTTPPGARPGGTRTNTVTAPLLAQ